MDLLIQHGTLVDGRGRYEADVLIRNGVSVPILKSERCLNPYND